ALQAANRRYLEFLSTLDDPSAGIDRLQKVSEPVRENERLPLNNPEHQTALCPFASPKPIRGEHFFQLLARRAKSIARLAKSTTEKTYARSMANTERTNSATPTVASVIPPWPHVCSLPRAAIRVGLAALVWWCRTSASACGLSRPSKRSTSRPRRWPDAHPTHNRVPPEFA